MDATDAADAADADPATADRWAGLARWLAPRLGATGPVAIDDVTEPAATGYSAETVLFRATYPTADGERTRRLVLRAETPDPPVYPPQAPGLAVEVEVQRRVMAAVAASSAVPLAPIVGHDSGGDAIGVPFFVMDFVDGVVPAVTPSYAAEGFFVDAAPGERRRLVLDGLRVLAEVHAIDWGTAGLGWLLPAGATPTLERQLDLWEALARRELGDRRHPGIEAGLARLRRHLPAGSEPVLCWGDPRPGNMIWRDFRCVCVTDWEAAAIAPPELDLGWWLMFDRASHEASGAARLAGEPTRDEQRDAYARASGRSVGDTRPHELFAALRYAAIAVRVLNRTVERGLLPPDHPFWLENPASTCLTQVLDE